jgi:hypothetical protein
MRGHLDALTAAAAKAACNGIVLATLRCAEWFIPYDMCKDALDDPMDTLGNQGMSLAGCDGSARQYSSRTDHPWLVEEGIAAGEGRTEDNILMHILIQRIDLPFAGVLGPSGRARSALGSMQPWARRVVNSRGIVTCLHPWTTGGSSPGYSCRGPYRSGGGVQWIWS